MLFWTNLPCDMAQHQSNQPPPRPLQAKAAAFGYNEKKKKLPAVISWLLKLAPSGWRNGFIPGWAVRGHWEHRGLLCIYCVRRGHFCSWDKDFFFFFFFHLTHTGYCCWVLPSLCWRVSLGGDTSLCLQHKKRACIASAIFLNIICLCPFLSVCPSWFTPLMHA